MKLSFSKVLLIATPFMAMVPSAVAVDTSTSCGLDICIAVDMSGSVCTPLDSDEGKNCYFCSEECHDKLFSKNVCCSAFDQQMKFAKDLVQYVKDELPDSRFSLVSFGNEASSHTNGLIGKEGFFAKVDTLDFVGGWTNTGSALELCFGTLDNDSPNKKAMVLITDGTPTIGAPDTEPAYGPAHKSYAEMKANEAKNKGISILPVLVNTLYSDNSFLKTLATDKTKVTTVSSFSELDSGMAAVVNLVNQECTAPPEERPETPEISTVPTCEDRPVSVCLALDMSGSVCTPAGSNAKACNYCERSCHEDDLFNKDVCCTNFDLTMQFSIDVATEVSNAVSSSDYSLVTFATNAQTNSGLVGKDQFITKVNGLDYSGGWTNTGDAIQSCFDTVKDSSNYKVIVLITDGTPTNGYPNLSAGYKEQHKTWATTKADLVKSNSITLIPVLIGTVSADLTYLKTLASNPDSVTAVENFDDLEDQLAMIAAKVKCQV